MIQSLTDLGFGGAARQLCGESGLELERPAVAAFRQAVLSGEWNRAEDLLFGTGIYDSGGGVGAVGDRAFANGKAGAVPKTPTREDDARRGLPLAEGAVESEMLFWIRQQKYLELVERRETGAALTVLRQELTPLRQDPGRLHALTRYERPGERVCVVNTD